MPYKPVTSKDHYGKNLITYKGQTIEVAYNRMTSRLNYVECSCGRIVQRQNWKISHINTQLCREFHYFNRDKILCYKVREDLTANDYIKQIK